jgi:branched-chain amino acid transport system ATP-binding protein
MTDVLVVRGLTVKFGGVVAIDDVDLCVAEGEIHGLVGPNGSGKTTLINCVSGFVRPAKGTIEFAGRQIAGARPYTRARLGIARSFQHPAMFTAMGTRESVLVGAHRLDRLGWHQALRPVGARKLHHELADRSTQIADRLGLVLSADPIASISFGQQRLADLARASVGEPTLLLLDEPASGLTDHELQQLIAVIRDLRDRGASVLVTDHNIAFMSEICDVITVVNVGRKIAEGAPDEIRAHPEVVAAYLGAGSGAPEQARGPALGRTPGDSLLTVTDLTCGYQGAPVLNRLSLDIPRHEVTSVVGPNGAGKTTLMRAISGMLKPHSGRVRFDGEDVTGEDGRRLLRRGVAHVPQGRGMFNGLTVQESLELGAYSISDKARRRDRLNEVLELFPILAERRKQLSGSLSGGEQQMLAIGRALMSHPQLLLLDEPTLGLAPVIIQRVVDMVHRLRDEGITVLVVEQNTTAAFEMSAWSYVLAGGRVVLHGPTAEVAGTPALTDAFLGAAKSLV